MLLRSGQEKSMSHWTRATVLPRGPSPQQVSYRTCCNLRVYKLMQPYKLSFTSFFSSPFISPAVASDRISIQSMGTMTPQLSPQNLISCDTRNQGGCAGGRIDGAWWYLRRRG